MEGGFILPWPVGMGGWGMRLFSTFSISPFLHMWDHGLGGLGVRWLEWVGSVGVTLGEVGRVAFGREGTCDF